MELVPKKADLRAEAPQILKFSKPQVAGKTKSDIIDSKFLLSFCCKFINFDIHVSFIAESSFQVAKKVRLLQVFDKELEEDVFQQLGASS